jgi:LAO/AO transport system kinase
LVAEKGTGLDDVMAALDKHLAWSQESGELQRRRTARARSEIEQIALRGLRARMARPGEGGDLDDLAEQVVAGTTDPYKAADRLVENL